MDIASLNPVLIAAAKIDVERMAVVLKKNQDVQEAQGQALVQLVQQAAATGTGRLIDARA